MFGLFMMNAEKDIAFSLMGDDRKIETALYAADSRMITFVLDNGDEELMNSEIAEEIHEGLMQNDILYVGNLSADQELTAEYEAKIVRI